jgi:hypothetical protein
MLLSQVEISNTIFPLLFINNSKCEKNPKSPLKEIIGLVNAHGFY